MGYDEQEPIWKAQNPGVVFIIVLTVFLMPMAFGTAWLVQEFGG
jgi:hypothetical protein